MLHSLLYVYGPFSIIKRNKIMESIPSSKYQSAAITKYIRFMFQFFFFSQLETGEANEKREGSEFYVKANERRRESYGDCGNILRAETLLQSNFMPFLLCGRKLNECVAHPFMSLFKRLIALSPNINSCQ